MKTGGQKAAGNPAVEVIQISFCKRSKREALGAGPILKDCLFLVNAYVGTLRNEAPRARPFSGAL